MEVKRKTVYSIFVILVMILMAFLCFFYFSSKENSLIYLCQNSDTSIIELFVKHDIDESKFDSFYYNQLTSKQKYIYHEINDCIENARNIFMFKTDDEIDVENIRHVIYAYCNDNPSVYTINHSNAFDCYYYKALKCVFVEIPKIRSDVSNSLIEYTVDTIIESLDDKYGKDLILELNDYICSNYSYNDSIDYHNDIRSMILSHQGVCLGYAKLMKLCLDKLGFENIVILGKTDFELSENDHAWNAVKVEDNWYYIDVTWADQEQHHYINHDYFLIGVNEYYEKHYNDEKFKYNFN